MKLAHTLLFASFTLFCAHTNADSELASLTKRWEISGLHQPESAVASPGKPLLYISNMNGSPFEKNGKGYISTAEKGSGKLLKQYWITGLDAPKGITIYQQKLYVADIQTLRVFDVNSGSPIAHYHVPAAQMLNDVAADENGNIYVSDWLEGTIYRLNQNKFTLWLKHPAIQHPNGLLYMNGELLIATWGENLQEDFSTEIPGSLYRFDLQSNQLTTTSEGFQLGNLDGITNAGEALWISDWKNGKLFKVEEGADTSSIQLEAGLADISTSGSLLLAPMMLDNTLIGWETSTLE